MDKLKKKAMLDVAKLFACAFGGATLLNLIVYYGPMLPFTAEHYGLVLAGVLLVFTARFAYKVRLGELERRERILNAKKV